MIAKIIYNSCKSEVYKEMEAIFTSDFYNAKDLYFYKDFADFKNNKIYYYLKKPFQAQILYIYKNENWVCEFDDWDLNDFPFTFENFKNIINKRFFAENITNLKDCYNFLENEKKEVWKDWLNSNVYYIKLKRSGEIEVLQLNEWLKNHIKEVLKYLKIKYTLKGDRFYLK